MILKLTWLYITDNSIINWISVIHLYYGFKRNYSKSNFYVKGTIKKLKNIFMFYKGFSIKKIVKGKIIKLIILRTVYNIIKTNLLVYKFKINTSLRIYKNKIIKSKFIFGFIIGNKFCIKKHLLLFKLVL